MLHELLRLINLYLRWLKVSITDKTTNYSKESGNRRNVHMVLKGATMSHWWKLLSFKFLLHQAQLPPRWKTEENPACVYISTSGLEWDVMVSKPSRDQDGMRVLVSAWEQQHLTVSSPADQRITHPGAEPALLSLLLKESTQRWEVVSKVGRHWQEKAGLLYVIYSNILPINTAYILCLQNNVYNLPRSNIKWPIYFAYDNPPLSISFSSSIFWNG